MDIINANRQNLASVLMGKNLYFPWRSQRNVAILVPYNEWLNFVIENQSYLSNRRVLSASNIIKANEVLRKRLFLYDISWALYTELIYSSNIQEESTLILPSIGYENTVTMKDIKSVCSNFSIEDKFKYKAMLDTMNNNYYSLFGNNSNGTVTLFIDSLSEWNALLFDVCLYLQSIISTKQDIQKFNIDWRIQ